MIPSLLPDPDEASSLRERKHLRARRKILEEATRLFEIAGYSSTTLREIAEAAELSIPTVMRYFGSKDAIFLYRHSRIVEELAGRLDTAAYTTLDAALRDAMTTSLDDLSERERLHEIIRDDPACEALNAKMRRDWESLLERVILAFSPPTRADQLRAKSLAYMLAASGMAGLEFWYEERKGGSPGVIQQDLINEFMATFIAPIDQAYLARQQAGSR